MALSSDLSRTTRLFMLIFACAVGVGVGVRVWLASRGHNFDMESWAITADLVAEGKNVYGNTYRHPYGPTWFLILGELRWLHDVLGLDEGLDRRLGAESFHIVVASFLSLADVGIALLLYRAIGIGAALFFVLNPVSMLLTGYHSQIDNLAILPALGAWLMLAPRAGPPRRAAPWGVLIGSAMLLALSLSIKHILIFFPLWVLMSPHLIGGLARRAGYACITYGVLLAIVIPFVLEPGAWTGFRKYVLTYDGLASNHTLLLHAIDLFAPPNAVDSLFGLVPAGVSILKRAFIVSLLVAGWWIARRRAGEMFWCYLLALVVLTNTMADQYLAIPLVACAVYWRRWPAWVYIIPAALLVYLPAAIDAGAFVAPAPRWHPYATHLSYPQAQVWVAILLAWVLARPREVHPNESITAATPPPGDSAHRA